MNLKFTIPLMCSENYKDRLKAEYYQVMIRAGRLKKRVKNYKNNDIKYDRSHELLKTQLHIMEEYLHVLVERMKIENIEITKEEK